METSYLDSANSRIGRVSIVVQRCQKFTTTISGLERVICFLVVGSMARKTDNLESDIDMLLIVDSVALKDEIEPRFRKLYFGLHRELGRPPDIEYPGELIAVAEYCNSINAAMCTRVTRSVSSIRTYDAIVWSSMLLGTQIVIAETNPHAEYLKAAAFNLLEKWRLVLAPAASMNEFVLRIKSHIKFEASAYVVTGELPSKAQ